MTSSVDLDLLKLSPGRCRVPDLHELADRLRLARRRRVDHRLSEQRLDAAEGGWLLGSMLPHQLERGFDQFALRRHRINKADALRLLRRVEHPFEQDLLG